VTKIDTKSKLKWRRPPFKTRSVADKSVAIAHICTKFGRWTKFYVQRIDVGKVR